MSIPTKMRAIVVVDGGNIDLQEVDVPKSGAGEVLVKVVTVSQNPTDWKTVKGAKKTGAIVGCDFAGTVAEIGPDVPEGVRKVGERVAGFVHGGLHKNGSFAEYVVADAQVIISVPDNISFEDAPQFGIAGYTALQTLYQSQSLPTPFGAFDASEINKNTTDASLSPSAGPTLDLLVWAGTSAVGQYVVQLAHNAGLRVIATCSPRNFELVKILGADAAFSYSDPDTPQKIKEYTGGALKYAVDCMSEEKTAQQIADAMSDAGGVVSVILPRQSTRKDIQTHESLVYTLLGKAIQVPRSIDAKPEHYEFGVKASALLNELLAKKKLLPSRTKIFPHGLASIKEGFQYMMDGKVSAEKLTYRIADTP